MQEFPERPVIVVICEQGHNVLDRLQQLYFAEGRRRWERLCQDERWLLFDLFYLLTEWNQVLDAVADNLASTVCELSVAAMSRSLWQTDAFRSGNTCLSKVVAFYDPGKGVTYGHCNLDRVARTRQTTQRYRPADKVFGCFWDQSAARRGKQRPFHFPFDGTIPCSGTL